jgi:hypothetical protein
MNASIPPALAAYFGAQDTANVEVLERCFTLDAVVRDEGRVMRGLDAIKAWKSAAQAKYKYRIEPLSALRGGGIATVLARVTGSFPGSPIELTYTFGLVGDKIASLEIR